MYSIYDCKINLNSHIAAMTETNRPKLCDKHLAEAMRDDVLKSCEATTGACDMCKVEDEIRKHAGEPWEDTTEERQ